MKNLLVKATGIAITAVLAFGSLGCKPEPHVHTEDNGNVITEPTYVTKGKIEYKCTDCSELLRTVTEYKAPAYKFTATVKVLPAGTDGTAGTEETYVEFGDFPQSEAAAEITYRPEPEANGYYVGSDGNYYKKVIAKVEPTWAKTLDFKDGDTVYFKVEPIKWRIFDTEYDYDGENNSDTAKLLVAESILNGNIPYKNYEKTTERNEIPGEEKTVYENNYKYSQVRAYLNGLIYYDDSCSEVETYKEKGFLQTAFTSSAQKLIKTTIVDNSTRSTYDQDDEYWKSRAETKYCDNTEDKLFLLSLYEIGKYKKAGESLSKTWPAPVRTRRVTTYARANYVYSDDNYVGNPDSNEIRGGFWYLRSPSESSATSAWHIDNGGAPTLLPIGIDKGVTPPGIVPALTIKF